MACGIARGVMQIRHMQQCSASGQCSMGRGESCPYTKGGHGECCMEHKADCCKGGEDKACCKEGKGEEKECCKDMKGAKATCSEKGDSAMPCCKDMQKSKSDK
ncbi:unnamed protein product [Sphagnum jensenii]|uniref:Uncharacterized protein n=1 Tax=Sphagnum jensenii TaxID=128206 RepID=A0ABP0VK77_9BRYO